MPLTDEMLQKLIAMFHSQQGQPATGGTGIMSQPGMNIPLVRPNDPETKELNISGLNSMMERENQRRGLKGQTPAIDPRLVDPSYSPLMSLGGMGRGDINLDTGREDMTPLLKYFAARKRLSY